MRGEARAVFRREAVVLAENVALDLDDAAAGQAGNLLTGGVCRTIDAVGRAMIMMVVMMVVMIMVMRVMMIVIIVGMTMMMMTVMVMMVAVVIMMMITRFDRGFAVTAPTDSTHHSTSSSLTRISSPPVTCS
jgi:hypothetical protein